MSANNLEATSVLNRLRQPSGPNLSTMRLYFETRFKVSPFVAIPEVEGDVQGGERGLQGRQVSGPEECLEAEVVGLDVGRKQRRGQVGQIRRLKRMIQLPSHLLSFFNFLLANFFQL